MANANEKSMGRSRRSRCLLGLVVLSASGCAGARRGPQLRCSPPVVRLEVVQWNVAENALWPKSAPTSGRVPPPPQGAIVGVRPGPRYSAVLTESSGRGPRQLWIYDLKWHLLGSVVGVPAGMDFQLVSAWSPRGDMLAIFAAGERRTRGTELGVVKPPDLRFQRLRLLEIDVFPGIPVWGEGGIIVAGHSAHGENEIWAVDPTTGRSTKLCAEAGALADETLFGEAIASPDQRYVAFGRASGSYNRLGIWLLDLRTREFREVTSEAGDTYLHTPLRWESPSRLVFARLDYDRRGAWDVYRAVVAPRDPPDLGATPVGKSGRGKSG